jgi:hypothetical protein
MSDELSAIIRAAAHDEAAAAARDLPLTTAHLGRFVRDVRRRRAISVAALTAATVTVAGAGALGLSLLWPNASTEIPPLPAATTSSPPEPSTPAPSASTSPTVGPTTSPSPSSEPTPSTSPTTVVTTPATPDAVAVPGQVTGVTAGAGGGSGEILVSWDPVANATGYRVYRSSLPDGPFARSASFDVATGRTTIEAEFPYEYIGIYPSWPQRFEYVDAVPVDGPAYFKVTAFNSGGESAPTAVVCGTPFGGPPC